MLKSTGPKLGGHSARALRWFLEVVLGLAIVILVCLGGLAWRLSQGPLDLPWLARRLEAAANEGSGALHVTIGRAALAWEGFQKGVDQPLDIRLSDVRATGPRGRTVAMVPQASVALSVRELLLARLMPRVIEIDGAHLVLLRAANGAVSLGFGLAAGESGGPSLPETPTPLPTLLSELAQPSQGATKTAPWFDALRVVAIRHASLMVIDRQLGATWRAPSARIDLKRHAAGGVTGSAEVALALGAVTAKLSVQAELASGGAGTHLVAHLTPTTPAALARAAPLLTPLSAIDAPATLSAAVDLNSTLGLRHFDFDASLGAGQVHIGDSDVKLRRGRLALSGSLTAITLRTLSVTLQGDHGDSVLSATGRAARNDGKLNATVDLALDRVAFADLPRIWPEDVGENARRWITENITDGVAHDGRVTLHLQGPADDPARLDLTGISGTLEGDGLTVHWLRPIPPITQGKAVVTFESPDAVRIDVASGRQGGLALGASSMRITGLTQKDQIGAIKATVTGTLPDALALLGQKRLHLLDRFPLNLKDPKGGIAVQLAVTLPLDVRVTLAQIAVSAQAKLTDVHLSGVVAGRDLDNGQLALDVNTDRLKLDGQAALAGIPTKFAAQMDFRAGGPADVTERATLSGNADAAQLAALGLPVGDAMRGPAAMNVTYALQRNGRAELDLRADLTSTALDLAALGWKKPAGEPASAAGRVVLRKDRVVGIESLHAEGPGLAVRGSADIGADQPGVLHLSQIVLGRSRAIGEVRFATQAGAPLRIRLEGPVIDLGPLLKRQGPPTRAKPGGQKPSAGPPWVLDARFARALATKDEALSDLSVHAQSDGRVVRSALVTVGGAVQARAVVAPVSGGRSLSLTAADAGALLRALNVVGSMQGGRLAISAHFDDARPDHPLSGTARIDDFRIRNAPALGRLLQAMTLYGLVQVLQGPGLGFTHLIAPFTLQGNLLNLGEARAFSPSLGLTATGSIDLAGQSANLKGTIVPAYFFNSLLGRIPLIGRLFSPEKGGGVFAATYVLDGSLANPRVSVNPLAAVTPGFLRGLFGVFTGGAK